MILNSRNDVRIVMDTVKIYRRIKHIFQFLISEGVDREVFKIHFEDFAYLTTANII